MRNSGLGEAQAGIKTARRNINNLRYADDTTLMIKRWRSSGNWQTLFLGGSKISADTAATNWTGRPGMLQAMGSQRVGHD